MTTVTPTNIISGPLTVWVAKIDGGEPAFPADPTATPAAGWDEVGSTERGSGWTESHDSTVEDSYVEEQFDPVDTAVTERTSTLEGILAEATLENLELAFGGGTITVDDPTGFTSYTPPTDDADTYWQIYAQGPGTGASKARDLLVYRAKPIGAIEIPHKRRPTKQVIACRFRLLVPAAGGAPWKVRNED